MSWGPGDSSSVSWMGITLNCESGKATEWHSAYIWRCKWQQVMFKVSSYALWGYNAALTALTDVCIFQFFSQQRLCMSTQLYTSLHYLNPLLNLFWTVSIWKGTLTLGHCCSATECWQHDTVCHSLSIDPFSSAYPVQGHGRRWVGGGCTPWTRCQSVTGLTFFILHCKSGKEFTSFLQFSYQRKDSARGGNPCTSVWCDRD